MKRVEKIKNVKKILAMLMVMVIIVGVFSACGQKQENDKVSLDDSKSQEQQGQDKEEVTIRYSFWGAQSDIDLTEYRINKFYEKQQNIKVEMVHIPDPYEDKLLAMIAGGTAPDVMLLYEVTTPVFAKQGTIIDLMPYVERDNFDLEDFFENVLEMARYDDGLYGLGSDFNPQVLYYNKTLFDEANVEYPSADWTWEDYLNAARKLTKKDENGKIIQWGSDALPSWWVPSMIAIWQNGGDIFNDDRTKSSFNSPEVIDALQWQADLALKEKVAPTPAQSQDLGDLFMTGKVAMTRTGTWMIRPYEEIKDFEWDIAPLPKNKEAATVIHTSYLAVSKDSKNPDAAWEFIKHMTSTEMQVYLSNNIRFLPQRKSAFNQKPFIKEGFPPANAQVLEEVISVGRMLPTANNIKQITDLFQKSLDEVYFGNKTAKEAMEELAPKVDELLEEE